MIVILATIDGDWLWVLLTAGFLFGWYAFSPIES